MEELKKWNPWWYEERVSEEFRGIYREITDNILDAVHLRPIKAIVGVRRSGKSTILYQIIDRLIKGGIDAREILYINLEEPKFLGVEIDDIIQEYIKLTKRDKRKCYLFLDEIQSKKNWEMWLKREYDIKGFKQIFVSGSSTLTSSDFHKLLAGRVLLFKVFPLSFKEFLIFRNYSLSNIEYLPAEEIAKIRHFLSEYIEYGGFPEVVLTPRDEDKVNLLSAYYDAITIKEIISKYKVDPLKVKNLAYYLHSNISSVYTYSKLRKFTGLSFDAVKHYLQIFEDAFLLFSLPIFSYSVKEQMNYPRKVYCIDTGLRNASAFRFSKDTGKLFENMIFLEFMRQKKDIYYWKDKGEKEIDFVVKEGLKINEIFQACYDISEPTVKSRELRGLLKALKEFSLKKGVILTENYEYEEKIIKKGEEYRIIYKPIWKWLMEASRRKKKGDLSNEDKDKI